MSVIATGMAAIQNRFPRENIASKQSVLFLRDHFLGQMEKSERQAKREENAAQKRNRAALQNNFPTGSKSVP
ncbi:hypothetical protein ACRQ5Q_12330 [Bradyrhizobium sp. PMVTL-01]|uniref:hypothetical protein n=1 Tax=Bradyrhizobium sp. PMVTL-01 TaxID=3434999 RepID=UPI003F71FDDD